MFVLAFSSSWNISKGIIRKLADGEFLKSVCENDIICFNECWVKYPKEFELNGYIENVTFIFSIKYVFVWWNVNSTHI
jgi:hypothetical protein